MDSTAHSARTRIPVSALENLPVAMMIAGADGLIRWVNSRLCEMTGYTPGELIGQDAGLLESGDHSFGRILAETAASGQPWTGGLTGRRKTGEAFTAAPAVVPIDGEGNIAELLVSWHEGPQEEAPHDGPVTCGQLCQSMMDGFASVDMSGRIRDFNEVFRAMLGYDRQELLALTYVDLTPESSRAPEAEIIRTQVIERGFSDIYEKEYRRKDGTVFPVELRTVLARNRGGEPAGMWAIVRDISARKRVEHDLRESESRLRQALRVGNMGYLDWDIRTNEILWSDETCRMYGFNPGEVTPTLESTVALVHPEDTESVAKRLEAAVRGESEYDIEHRMVRPDGRIIHVNAKGRVTRDADGNALRMLGTVVDITARKRAEEVLRTTREHYRQLIEQAADGIFATDREGRFVLVNSAICRMLGYTEEEILGKSVLDTYTEGDRENGKLRRNQIRQGDLRFERFMRRKDGTTFPIEASTTRRADGNVQAIVRDVSDRKAAEQLRTRLEDQLRQAQKLESIGRLAGGVAHDFNNLLTVITCNCSFLTMGLNPGDPDWEYAEEINKAAEHAASLTKQLLAFSRKQIIRPSRLDLNKVVTDMSNMLQRLLGEDIQMSTALDPSIGHTLADPGQIHQVLMNLAANARDAMPHGGKLILETSNFECGGRRETAGPEIEPGSYVMLTVTDTGAGMDEQTREHIFEPFFTTKEPGKGAGLGLSTVYGIIRQSDGWVWVDSSPGHGASFKIVLPRIDFCEPSLPVCENAPDSLRGSETLLVVEDQDDIRKLVTGILTGYGYRVIDAPDGQAAIRASEAHPNEIHLMVTDVVLPGINGRQVAERLAVLRPRMKVLYVSGYTADAIAERGVLASATAYLPKPFRPETLAAKVREVLGR